MDSSEVGMVTLAATQGIVLFTTLCPDRSSLYDTAPDHRVKQNLRQGELVATVLTMGFAGAIAMYSGSRTPLFLAAATVVTLIGAYEFTMHLTPTGDVS